MPLAEVEPAARALGVVLVVDAAGGERLDPPAAVAAGARVVAQVPRPGLALVAGSAVVLTVATD